MCCVEFTWGEFMGATITGVLSIHLAQCQLQCPCRRPQMVL